MIIFSEIQKYVGEWGAKTFGGGLDRCKPIANHLKREVSELQYAIDEANWATDVQAEAADCAILLMGIAHNAGFDLGKAVLDKMAHNEKRKWGKPDAEGVVEHLED